MKSNSTKGITDRLVAKLTGKYYVEDYIRVYPDNIMFDTLGGQLLADKNYINNYLNHTKVYTFAAQFVDKKRVADIGCGSGYGSEILKRAGAMQICGADASKVAIEFAKSRFADYAEFTVQDITNLYLYPDNSFDIVFCSEVLEHVKEYGAEEKSIIELKRIAKKGGVLILGTPNSELLGDHGFYFDEINHLFKKHFSLYCIFENALVPYGEGKKLWEQRAANGKIGVIISENINISEVAALPDGGLIELKKGLPPGIHKFASYEVNTTLLHNTHSWLVLAIKN